MTLSISIVIPVHNGGLAFRACLSSLAPHRNEFCECIVVDDGSTDESVSYAREFGANVLRIESRQGPANGRNLGAWAARGDILMFLDADVCVHEETLPRIRQRFEDSPEMAALFGSYDSEPAAPGLVSQFRNLLHHYVHQTGKRMASTFWTGCGAVRREIFFRNGGFDTDYWGIEDVEFGSRLVRNRMWIVLAPDIQVKHLKKWTLQSMVVTDIRYRGVPWTRLILNSRRMPNDLNLRASSRASVAMLGTLYTLAAAVAVWSGGSAPLPEWGQMLPLLLLFVSVILLNLPFYRFLGARRNHRFAAACVPLHLIYLSCCLAALVVGISVHYRSRLLFKSGAAVLAPSGD